MCSSDLQANLPTGARNADQSGRDIPRNMEADLDSGGELLLQATANVPVHTAPETNERPNNVEIPPNGPVKIIDENPLGEIILSSSSSNAVNGSGMSLIEEDPLSTWKCKHCPAVFLDWITFQSMFFSTELSKLVEWVLKFISFRS